MKKWKLGVKRLIHLFSPIFEVSSNSCMYPLLKLNDNCVQGFLYIDLVHT